jgi:hypothetical protein
MSTYRMMQKENWVCTAINVNAGGKVFECILQTHRSVTTWAQACNLVGRLLGTIPPYH